MAKLIITYGDHKGRVRARTIVEYVDGSRGRLEAYGGSKRDKGKPRRKKLRKGTVRFDMASRSGQVT